MPRVKLLDTANQIIKSILDKLPAILPPDVEPEPIGPMKDIVSDSKCHFIRGDVKRGVWRMCGHNKKSDQKKPWCKYHHKVVHEPEKARK